MVNALKVTKNNHQLKISVEPEIIALFFKSAQALDCLCL